MAEKSQDRGAYPDALRQAENRLVELRRKGARIDGDLPRVGFALSGGGIRSATFSLGVFQSLAKYELLKRIDYLSTVSGGGYFGSFLGRLFTREGIDVYKVEKILSPDDGIPGDPLSPDSGFKNGVLRWLRENGRYIAPKGAGDLLLDLAVLFRNWVAIQVVVATLVLTAFLTTQLLRCGWELHFLERPWWKTLQGLWDNGLAPERTFWWSPYALVAAVALFFVVPPGWAYWLIERRERGRSGWIPPYIGALAAVGLGIVGATIAFRLQHPVLTYGASLLALAGLLTIVLWRWARARAQQIAKMSLPHDSDQRPLFEDSTARNWLSSLLKAALLATGFLIIFTLIDSTGQTLYVAAITGKIDIRLWVTSIVTPLAGLAGFARTIAVTFGRKADGKRPSIPLKVVASVAAIVVVSVVLITLDTCSHAIAWNLKIPPGTLSVQSEPPAARLALKDAAVLVVTGQPDNWQVQAAQGADPSHTTQQCCKYEVQAAQGADPSHTDAPAPSPVKWSDWAREHPQKPLLAVGGAWAIGIIFCVLFGRSWPFLNRSTHLPLYSARLTRAYLGASNAARLTDGGKTVSEVIPDDDIAQKDYWPLLRTAQELPNPLPEPLPDTKAALAKGAPLHLLNVTINETLDGRSQVQQQDRKGTGMAIGPAAISSGIRHHVVFSATNDIEQQVKIYPVGDEYRVFDYKDGKFHGEVLSLGSWTAISGAAFSTGLGWRTSLGISTLTGFANVRLGYWWDSLIERTPAEGVRTKWSRVMGRLFTRVFPVQSYLLDEFLARFHGTARRYWYLSDGGHFENMGAYELIRRRLDVIVVVDAEQDADYTYEGLANLIRKARLDFSAEIQFLNETQLEKVVHKDVRPYFGTLEELRRGTWTDEPVIDPSSRAKRLSIAAIEERRSLAHAALAYVSYDGAEPPFDDKGLVKQAPESPNGGRGKGWTSWLLYLKPGLTGDEPADVLRYHAEHPIFPQETTADQFFDEAQWESYRKLGEHIADVIFQKRDPQPGKFLPHDLRPPA